MIKDIAWNTFKNTGSIKTFLELKQIEHLENNNMYEQKVKLNEYSENERNNNSRK